MHGKHRMPFSPSRRLHHVETATAITKKAIISLLTVSASKGAIMGN